jgi:FixJ family two-component response regulator
MDAWAPRVYLVDDDPDVRKAIGRLLESAGLEVASFASAQQFLDGYDRSAPACLVLDLAMPGLNGLELQAALEREASPLPIIFLTGRGDIATSVQAMKHGAADFLTKPVDDAALLAAVHDALATSRSRHRAGQERAAGHRHPRFAQRHHHHQRQASAAARSEIRRGDQAEGLGIDRVVGAPCGAAEEGAQRAADHDRTTPASAAPAPSAASSRRPRWTASRKTACATRISTPRRSVLADARRADHRAQPPRRPASAWSVKSPPASPATTRSSARRTAPSARS